jgi:hypothetical protein
MSRIRLPANTVEIVRTEYRDTAVPGFGLRPSEAYQATWRRVCDRLRSEVGKNAFENWLAHLELQQIADGALRIILIAPTRALQHWVYNHHFDLLLDPLRAATERVGAVVTGNGDHKPGADVIAINRR